MKLCVTGIVLFATVAINAQIEIVQFSAEFLKENEVSLKPFKAYDAKTLYMSKESAMFKKLDIKYIPTLVLFNNGEEVMRVESGISLKLPENAIQRIEEEIEEIIDSKF
tara:strand:- start:1281 stop:1607 length:327 start_codon:yes stop_codon:yes gene_type:complete